MIEERSLLAAIKDAWRTGGYSVVGNGGELVLQGSGWLAVLPRGIVPRKVLALLVEHLGEIPEGAAWKVYKKQGAQAQMVAMGVGDAMAYGQRLVWDDEGGLLVVAPRRDDIEDALRQRLEQLPLA